MGGTDLFYDIERSCCFTGHRILEEKKIGTIKKALDLEIRWLVSHGITTFYAGGAIGFDMLAEQAVIDVRRGNPSVKLYIVIPCHDQDCSFSRVDRERYRYLLDQADDSVCLSEHFYSGCMHRRNRYMVDRSGYCICWLEETDGGTAYTVDYAMKNDRRIINLALRPPDDNEFDFE